MVWPLTLSAHQTHTRRVQASKDKIVYFLHHHLDVLIRLNPLVTATSRDPDIPNKYVVEDVVSVFGYPSKVVYTVAFTLTDHGVSGDVEAAAGTRTKSVFTVTEVEDGACDITEHVTVSAYFIFIPYILITQRKPHETLLERLKDHLERDSQ